MSISYNVTILHINTFHQELIPEILNTHKTFLDGIKFFSINKIQFQLMQGEVSNTYLQNPTHWG